VTVFEGARLITGDGSPPIENSAFVVENNGSPRSAGAARCRSRPARKRVDISGKNRDADRWSNCTAISGSRTSRQGRCSKETFTRENLIESSAAARLPRRRRRGLASAISSIAPTCMAAAPDGVDVPLRLREEVVPNAGAVPHLRCRHGVAGDRATRAIPSRVDVSYPVSTPQEGARGPSTTTSR